MPEQLPDQPLLPLSEADLDPIIPLDSNQVLNIGQQFTRASFETERLRRKIEQTEDKVDIDVAESFIWEKSNSTVLRIVLELLGQQRLISRIETGLKELFPEKE